MASVPVREMCLMPVANHDDVLVEVPLDVDYFRSQLVAAQCRAGGIEIEFLGPNSNAHMVFRAASYSDHRLLVRAADHLRVERKRDDAWTGCAGGVDREFDSVEESERSGMSRRRLLMVASLVVSLIILLSLNEDTWIRFFRGRNTGEPSADEFGAMSSPDYPIGVAHALSDPQINTSIHEIC